MGLPSYLRSCAIKLADYKWHSCLDAVSSERGRLIVKVEWEWREGREVLPKVAKAKRPNGNEGRREGRRGIHPIILTRKKVAGNKMDCGEKGGKEHWGQYLNDVQQLFVWGPTRCSHQRGQRIYQHITTIIITIIMIIIVITKFILVLTMSSAGGRLCVRETAQKSFFPPVQHLCGD